jgi:hypothetical protein
MLKRRILLIIAAIFPLAAHAACSATNGDAIPSVVYDASALDVGTNPDELDAATTTKDGAAVKDGATRDAPDDAPTDSPVVNTAPVQINEVFVDNNSFGDGAEYVELRAAPGTPADDLKLRLIYSDGQVKYEVSVGDPGAKFPASGLWTVGGGQTFKLNVLDHIDRTVGLNAWGLDNFHGAVQVVRGATLLDVVGYSTDPDAGALAMPASAPKATVEGSPAVVPAPANGMNAKGLSFGRKTGVADTNDNAADFCKMEASPGYAQKACQ